RQHFLHSLEGFRWSHDVPRRTIIFQIFGARVEHEIQQFILAGGFLWNSNFSFAVEHPADRSGLRQVAAVLGHQVAKLAYQPVAIRGNRLNEHAHAAGTITLKGHFFVLLAFELAGAAQNGALDIVVWHVLVFRRKNRRPQARVGVRISAADTRGDRDFSYDSREHAAALRVGGRLLVLNRGPFGMPGHDASSFAST